MTNHPLISIITPVYNAEKYILDCIESVLNQTYNNWEFILVNDGSTDNTENLIIPYLKDKRIILLNKKNGGVSSARNKALNIAKGKYLTFLDADDLLTLNSLKIRAEYLEKNPSIDIIDGNILIKDSNLEKVKKVYTPNFRGLLLPELMKINEKVFFNVCYMIKKESIGETLFNEKMTHGEDLLFFIEISAMKSAKYDFINDNVYIYRKGHESAMSNMYGLEKGYMQLIEYTKRNKNITRFQKFTFQKRIARILFLSWLFDKKSLKNAIKSLFYVTKLFKYKGI